MVTREISVLLKKDFRLELRQRSSLGAVMLYVFATLFVCYFAFEYLPDAHSWNALFWLVMLFSSVNAISRRLFIERNKVETLYTNLVSPVSLIVSRLVYNAVLSLVLGIVVFIMFFLLLGNPLQNAWLFLPGLFLGSVGFSVLFTFITAIATRAGNAFALTAVLGFPLSLPLILVCVQYTNSCLGMASSMSQYGSLLLLFFLDVLLILMTVLLFPYLWRD